jgi:hypothetical protein
VGASELRKGKPEVISETVTAFTLLFAKRCEAGRSRGQERPEGLGQLAAAWPEQLGDQQGPTSTHHDAGTSSPEVVKLAENVSDVILGRRHVLQAGDDMAVWVLKLFEWGGKWSL